MRFITDKGEVDIPTEHILAAAASHGWSERASSELQAQSARCSVAAGSASVALDAYRDLMTGPMPQNETHFRRAVMLAVLIGRQIESDHRDHSSPNIQVSRGAQPTPGSQHL